jgi:hypothetical protein
VTSGGSTGRPELFDLATAGERLFAVGTTRGRVHGAGIVLVSSDGITFRRDPSSGKFAVVTNAVALGRELAVYGHQVAADDPEEGTGVLLATTANGELAERPTPPSRSILAASFLPDARVAVLLANGTPEGSLLVIATAHGKWERPAVALPDEPNVADLVLVGHELIATSYTTSSAIAVEELH